MKNQANVCLFFDLDDTLLDFKVSEGEALKKTLIANRISPTDELLSRYHVINAEHWKRLERGELTREEVKLKRYEALCREFSLAAAPERLRDEYEEALSHEVCFVEGAIELLETLAPDYRLFLLSNGTAKVQRGRLAASGISRYFEKIFVSEEIGFVKPQKEFFEVCFSEIENFSKENAMMIGDSPTSDILGGKNAGICTCRFCPEEDASEPILPDFRIQKLSDLPNLLNAWKKRV